MYLGRYRLHVHSVTSTSSHLATACDNDTPPTATDTHSLAVPPKKSHCTMLSVSSDSFSSYTDSSRPRRCDGMPYCVTAAPKTLITAQKTITVPNNTRITRSAVLTNQQNVYRRADSRVYTDITAAVVQKSSNPNFPHNLPNQHHTATAADNTERTVPVA
jgi:hypothetical protein